MLGMNGRAVAESLTAHAGNKSRLHVGLHGVSDLRADESDAVIIQKPFARRVLLQEAARSDCPRGKIAET